jgi:hypothetical protein
VGGEVVHLPGVGGGEVVHLPGVGGGEVVHLPGVGGGEVVHLPVSLANFSNFVNETVFQNAKTGYSKKSW